MTTIKVVICVLLLGAVLPMLAQQSGSYPANTTIPPLINFSGTLTDLNRKPLTGVVGVTYLLYKDQEGGAPLWMETQNVEPDAKGHYTVMLGSTTSTGLPSDIFVAGEARWLGVQAQGQAEQPRVMLLSVPYAMKAKDAETIAGLPPSAFVLAARPASSSNSMHSGSSASPASPPPLGGTGTTDFVPLWTNGTTLGNSVLFQSGSGSTAKIGINTTTPAFTLDVKGGEAVRGILSLPATGTATATKGTNSEPLNQTASAFNSSTKKAVNQTFQWQAEPAGNDTASPSATLNLLFGSGGAAPAETGLNITSTGVISLGNLTASSSLGIGTTSPQGTLDVLAATANVHTFVGDVGCGHNNAGIIFAATRTANCQTYALSGDTNGNTYVDAPGGDLELRVFPNTTGLIVDTSANVEILNHLTVGGGVAAGTTFSGGFGVLAKGFTASSGSGLNGTSAVNATGGNGDPNAFSGGGNGIEAIGGMGGSGSGGAGIGGNGIIATGGAANTSTFPGVGGGFSGGNSTNCSGDECGGDGIDGITGTGAGGVADGYAGNFVGDVHVSGAVIAGTKDFKIDHPLDPANKYLVHASVESSEMKNIYDGNVVTDAQGEATVRLPEWFEVLNTDFRYQLTVIGQFAQAIVAQEIESHRFTIRTSAPNVKVSWQVTGVRQDAYAKAHPLVVEEEKDARLKGFYIHPELYGAPAERQIEWSRHPGMMKKLQASQQLVKESQLQLAPSAAPGSRR